MKPDIKQPILSFLVTLGLCFSCAGSEMERWNTLPQQLLDNTDESIWGVFDRCRGTLGTAFVVTWEDQQYLVTSLHVIRGFRLDESLDNQIKISRSEIHGKMDTKSTKTLTKVKAIYLDDILDIAILTAEGIDTLPALHLSEYSPKRVRVFSIGLAQAKDYFGMSITEGIISNPNKEVVVESRAFKQTHIEHTAPLVGGQSGGPLVDMNGHVIGVNSFARGNRGLHLYYATALTKAFTRMKLDGRLEIRNTGTARIKEIQVTPFGQKTAQIDKLPKEIGKVNGKQVIRFGMQAGKYTIVLTTEEKKQHTQEVTIIPKETQVIDYAYGTSGIRVVNSGCQKIVALCLLNPVAQRMMDLIINDDKIPQKEKADRMRRLLLSQDILEENTLSPGQTWIEWVTDWEYSLYAFTWDPEIGEFIMPDPRTIIVSPNETTNIYLND